MWCPVKTSGSLIYPNIEKVSSLSRSDPITVFPPFPFPLCPFVCKPNAPRHVREIRASRDQKDGLTSSERCVFAFFCFLFLFLFLRFWTFGFDSFWLWGVKAIRGWLDIANSGGAVYKIFFVVLVMFEVECWVVIVFCSDKTGKFPVTVEIVLGMLERRCFGYINKIGQLFDFLRSPLTYK